MEKLKIPDHKHPLLPISRFFGARCGRCWDDYIYGGYCCNELGCGYVIHRECAEPLREINHSLHPDHPLKLLQSEEVFHCSQCGKYLRDGYECSICDFKLDLRCVKETVHILQNSNLHQHPLSLTWRYSEQNDSRRYDSPIAENNKFYACYSCSNEVVLSVECVVLEANHISHPQHPLKLLTVAAAPDYADKKCLLCEEGFDYRHQHQLYYCDVCNFSICPRCMKLPPPIVVESPTTHGHELHLVPRRIDFTCNACGTLGDRSPYFCLQCNFMIHRECIDLPRVININRHDHRISYTPRLGHEKEWKCKVCRKMVDGFYGGYTCVKCPSFVVHSLCATRNGVWDMRELEGMPEEEEDIPPFEVIDANTIKHFSHNHNLLRINKDGHDHIQPENIVCEACRLEILSEPAYSCNMQCNYIIHDKCANHPRKKRHVCHNLPFTLFTDYRRKVDDCQICGEEFSGFRYKAGSSMIIDVRCAAILDTLEHGSHHRPLYYYKNLDFQRSCSRCGNSKEHLYSCDECDYTLDSNCAKLPEKVIRQRYDDHPLLLSFGEKNVDDDYWCKACETKVAGKEWFYACNDCGTILHVSCVVGETSYIMPGSRPGVGGHIYEVVTNTSICRPLCSGKCKSRCKLSSILKHSFEGLDAYYCSLRCRYPDYEEEDSSESSISSLVHLNPPSLP